MRINCIVLGKETRTQNFFYDLKAGSIFVQRFFPLTQFQMIFDSLMSAHKVRKTLVIDSFTSPHHNAFVKLMSKQKILSIFVCEGVYLAPMFKEIAKD